jgi:hypothetical protein
VKRTVPISLKRHVKHLLNLSDGRFQEHPLHSLHSIFCNVMKCC